MKWLVPFLLLSAPACAQVASVRDIYSGPFPGEVPTTVGAAAVAPNLYRALKANCTAAGTVTVTYQDGSSGVWNVTATTQVLPIAIQSITAAGATCTYAYLK